MGSKISCIVSNGQMKKQAHGGSGANKWFIMKSAIYIISAFKNTEPLKQDIKNLCINNFQKYK